MENKRGQIMVKYNHSDHIAILSEIITLQTIMTETQCKIQVAKEKEKRMTEQKKADEDVPF